MEVTNTISTNARLMIHMKCQAIFSQNQNNKTYLKMLSVGTWHIKIAAMYIVLTSFFSDKQK